MGSINVAADEVANTLITELGTYDADPIQRAAHLETAKLAALLMSDRLGNSIPAEDFYERIIDFQSRAFSQAQGHNQIYIGIGYATLTTVWAATASNISVPAMLLSGGCLLFSASIFVAWTITGMLANYTTLMNTRDVYAEGPVDFISRNAKAEQANLQTVQKVQRWWKPIVAAAGIPALIAAATLVISAGNGIIQQALVAHRSDTTKLNSVLPRPHPAAQPPAPDQPPAAPLPPPVSPETPRA